MRTEESAPTSSSLRFLQVFPLISRFPGVVIWLTVKTAPGTRACLLSQCCFPALSLLGMEPNLLLQGDGSENFKTHAGIQGKDTAEQRQNSLVTSQLQDRKLNALVSLVRPREHMWLNGLPQSWAYHWTGPSLVTGESLPNSDHHKNLSFSSDHRFTHKLPPSCPRTMEPLPPAGCLSGQAVCMKNVCYCSWSGLPPCEIPERSREPSSQGSEGRQGLWREKRQVVV